jgi:hypothetical protein
MLKPLSAKKVPAKLDVARPAMVSIGRRRTSKARNGSDSATRAPTFLANWMRLMVAGLSWWSRKPSTTPPTMGVLTLK